jgi:hypothetical protein
MSYWNYANRNKTEEQQKLMLKLTEKSVNLINQYNGEVHLITDSLGKEIFKKIKFASIDTYLDCVPKKYYQVWCLGKMYALNKIADKNEPFIHIDYDFLIFKKIPEYILKKDIIIQSPERNLKGLYYNIDYFNKICINKYFCKDNNANYAYNCGIMGGEDYNFFKIFSVASINMILDKENENLFLKTNDEHYKLNSNFRDWTTSVLAEQYHIANACKIFEKNVCYFYKELAPLTSKSHNYIYSPDIKEYFLESKTIHLYGVYKYKKNLIDLYIN